MDYYNRIVIGSKGFKVALNQTTPNNTFLLARYLQTGLIDRTFGANGVTVTNLLQKYIQNVDPSAGVQSLTIDTSQRIIAAGTVSLDENQTVGFAGARYLTTGNLDTSFGVQGLVITQVLGQQDLGLLVAIDVRSNIYIMGASYTNPPFEASYVSVVRYLQSGVIDKTFGPNNNGKASTELFNGTRYSAFCGGIDRNGRVMMGESALPRFTHPELMLARYTSDYGLLFTKIS